MFPISFAAFVLAFVVALVFVPVAKLIAIWGGVVDRPDKSRKLHARTVPLAGGITIGVCLPIVLGASVFFSEAVYRSLETSWISLLGLALGSAVMLMVGLADDRWGVAGRKKLVGQILSAGIFLAFFFLQNYVNTNSSAIVLFGGSVHFAVAFVFLFVWLIGSVNAVNLIDGADGLASTVGTIASISIFLMVSKSHGTGIIPWEGIMAIGLSGILLGFLFYNFPPATTFLGDSGSMLSGLLIGCLAIQSSHAQPISIALFAPIAIVAVPFFDSFVAILRRRLTGRSIYTVDRGHLHHTLLERGLSPRGMLAVVAVLCSISALGGVLSSHLGSPWYAIGSVVLVVGGLVSGRVFGFTEMQLLVRRLNGLGRKWVMPDSKLSEFPHQQKTHLQGSRNWDVLWEAITEFAEERGLSEVRLDLNLPWLHEGYHAVWHRRVDAESNSRWVTRVPLTGEGRTYGRLDISGPLTNSSMYHLLGDLAELLESLETVIVKLAQSPDSQAVTPAAAVEVPVIGSQPEFTKVPS